MKKCIPFVVVAVAGLVDPVLAQLRPLEVSTVGFHVAVARFTPELTSGLRDPKGLDWWLQGGTLQGVWGWPVGQSTVLSLGASYRVMDATEADGIPPADAIFWHRKHGFAVFLEPGFKLSERNQAYVKIDYESTTWRDEFASSNVDRDMVTVSYGLGMRALVRENMYLQTDIKYSFYGSSFYPSSGVGLKPSASSGQVGLRYQF